MILVVILGFAGSLIALFLTKIGIRRSTAVFTVFVATIMLVRGGQMVSGFSGSLGWLIILLPIALAGLLGARLGDHLAIEITMISLGVVLASGPPISLAISLQEFGRDNVLDSEIVAVELEEKPNVFLIVLDAYPGLIALERGFGQTKEEVVRVLTARGFQIPDSAWSAYWSTETALPSILQMEYPIEEGDLNPATRKHLHEIIGGDSNLVETLKTSGYQTVMLESGWTGSSCGEAFDRCVTSPWLDDLVYVMLWEGVIRAPLLETYGHAYTAGVQATMRSLRVLANVKSVEGGPMFVMAHVIAPHGPFFLDDTCDTVVSDDRVGDEFYAPGVDRAVRESYYFDQMQCVDQFMEEFAGLVDPADVVVFVADHGAGRLGGHLEQTVQTWDTVIERMNVFTAIRVRQGCDIGESIVTVNLMRRVLSCYSESPVGDVANRIFLPGFHELAPDEVESLVARSEIPG